MATWDDRSDEEGCTYFVCDNGKKIAMEKKCDNNLDCKDGSDEKDCAAKDLIRIEGSCANKDHQRLMVDPRFMIVQSLGSFLTAG